MNENSKLKFVNGLDDVGGFLPYLVTFEFPLCFAMLVTFLVKMAGMQGRFLDGTGVSGLFLSSHYVGECFQNSSGKAGRNQEQMEKGSHWSDGILCALFAIVFGVILVKKFDAIVAKL